MIPYVLIAIVVCSLLFTWFYKSKKKQQTKTSQGRTTKEPTQKEEEWWDDGIEYFVYKYTFPNGKIYIGRSHNKAHRFGNVEQYQGQVVYEAMLKYPNFKKEIIYRSRNIYKVAKFEHMRIVETYDYNYNVSKEYNWQEHVKEEIKERKARHYEYERNKRKYRYRGK